MLRKMIEIDEAKCNGCGRCIPNCPEGALQIIDGKARLVSDLFCDGLGACLGECPQGALRTVEREAEAYDERLVMANIVPQGANTIAAHLKHLKAHGERQLYETALDYLKELNLPIPDAAQLSEKMPCGCPGSLAGKLKPKSSGQCFASGASALRQWPVQLKLMRPDASYFDHADLLVSADCVAHAYGAFHGELLAGKVLMVFCPKLDRDLEEYVQKLKEIFMRHEIRSITIARMEVPCCGGTVAIVKEALEAAEKNIPVTVKIVGMDGSLQ